MKEPDIECPACHSKDIHSRGKRYAVYPVGILAIVGLPLAMLHQASAPFDYRCNACGQNFARQSRFARVMRGVFLTVIWFFGIFVALAFVAAFFRH